MQRNKARSLIMFVSLIWSVSFAVLAPSLVAVDNFVTRHLHYPNGEQPPIYTLHDGFMAGLAGGAIMFFGTLIATFLFPPGERPKSTNRHS